MAVPGRPLRRSVPRLQRGPLGPGLTTSFYNELAAVPSLHAGFAAAVGIALALAHRRRSARLLALSWGPLIALAVVATGNHFLFDIAARLTVTAAGFGLSVAAGRPIAAISPTPRVGLAATAEA
jgi:membrane-associated phospholipid phosphatase